MATPEELRSLAQGQEDTRAAGTPMSERPGSRPQAEQTDSGLREFGSQFLRGVVNMARPIARLQPIGGSLVPTEQQIAEQSGGVIATEEPETFPGRMGRVSGAAASAAVPIGGAASAVPRAVQTGGPFLQRMGRGIQNLISSSGQSFRQRPGQFVAGEATVGGVAGASGLAAERTFPDSDAARFTGELLGGTAFQIAPARLLLRGAGKLKRTIQSPRTEIGARRRAARRASEAPTPGERARSIVELDRPTTPDPETGKPVLTPAQRTESPALLSLERSVVNSSEQLQREADEQIAQANQVIQQSARDIGHGGTADDTAGTIEEAQGYLQSLLNTRLRVAAQRTDERVSELSRGASREDANRIAREELEKASEAARTQERQLFQRVDPETAVPSTNAQSKLEEWTGELGRAQQKNIPADAKNLLRPSSNRFLGNTTNIREMRSLQSELRAQARRARSNENFQKAAIADDIADSITDDLSSAGEQSEALQLAVDFSRNYRQRFRQGTVGRIFGREATGGQRIREGETLERTIGGGGPGEREALDELRTALTDPEITRLTGTDAETFNAAASDFVRRRFLNRAAPEGELNISRANAFLRDNEQLLSRMPDVEQELRQSVQAGNAQNIIANRRKGTRFNDPNVSRATLFVRKGPVKAFQEISGESPSRAARKTQQLLNRAKKDTTGKATAGLKSGYVDFLLRPETQRDVAGQPFVSGFKMRETRQNPSVKAAERRLLSDAEIKRLDTIERDLVRVEKARDAKPSPQGIIGDRPSKVVETIAGISGAAVGRQSAANVGAGGTVQIPGIMANRFREMAAAGVQDPAERLMRDAVRDEALFRDLLQARVPPDGELPEKATNRLNAWVAGVLNEQGVQPEEQTQEPSTVQELRQLAQ